MPTPMLLESRIIRHVQDNVDTSAFLHMGLNFWPLVRLEIHAKAYFHRSPQIPVSSQDPGRGACTKLKPLSLAALFLKRLAHRPICSVRQARQLHWMRKQRPVDVVFLSREQYHSEKVDGAWYDRCVDPFIELAEGRFRHLKVEVSEKLGRTPRRHDTLALDPNPARYRAAGRLLSPRQPTAAFLAGLAAVASAMAEAGIPGGLDANSILRQAEELLLYRDMLVKVLGAVRPKAVFFTCIIDPISLSAVAACKQLGITSVEIHHGYGGNNHPVYTHHRAVPPGGFDLLPDISWMWTEDSATAFASWYPPGSPHQFLFGGNLWLAKWLGHSPPPLPPEHTRFLLSARKSERVVLFSAALAAPVSELFPPALTEAMRLTGDDCLWLIRLHPNSREIEHEVAAYLKARGLNNFEIPQATQCPLHALLQVVDHHVTFFSSVYFEAKQFGIHTTAIVEMAEVYLAEFKDDPMLHFCRSPEEIARNVRTCPREQQAASLLVRPPGEALELFTRIVAGEVTPGAGDQP